MVMKWVWLFLLFHFLNADNRISLDSSLFKPIENYFLIRQFFNDESTTRKYFESLNNVSHVAQLRSVPPGFDEKWTLKGPSGIGARINVIKPDPKNNNLIFLGFSSGGVWKTLDGGKNWLPIFDDFPWLAIADINVDPTNSQNIYVATGDPNISGYPFVGDGIYKSIDGGVTWKNIGPAGIQVISKIIIHPVYPNILYASSMGLPFQRDKLRGIYKSTNGGQSWEKVLHVADDTGVIDLIIDPFNPAALYAASWPRIRNNKESLLFGASANIWKSSDNGTTWKISSSGLTPGPKGRIGIVASKKTPNLLFSIVMGENNEWEGFYKSMNGGETWSNIFAKQSINGIPENAMGGFGWYFGKIEINPFNDQDLFILGVDLWRSKDGGLTWQLGAPPWYENNLHADKHDLVFLNENEYILASDGGAYLSKDKGATWSDFEQIPTTQFYRIAFNPHKPSFFYGGAQDHGTLEGNASDSWTRLYGGDGFQQVFDPQNENIIYTLSQNGNILVSTDKGLSFNSAMSGIDKFEPVAWDAPLIMSPFNSNTLYTGTSRVYKNTSGKNAAWKPLSGDLTDGNIYGARFHNITSLNESPTLQGLLYAGTSDANCWRLDPIANLWTNISGGLPERYVTSIQASPTFSDYVYVTQSGYKDNDWQSHIFLSKDRGEKWKSIKGDLPYISINDLVVIPEKNDSLLFVATDAGVYGSINAGKNWFKLGINLPLVAVYDLLYVPEKKELIAGTFGRSIHTYSLKSLLENKFTVSVSPSNINFPSGGGSMNFSIVSNTSWQLTTSDSFLSLSKNTGLNNGIVTVSCGENKSFEKRFGTILLKGDGTSSILINIVQDAKLPQWAISAQQLDFSSAGGSQFLTLSSNTQWIVVESLDFISTNVRQNNGNDTIEVKCKVNYSSNRREGYLAFYPSGLDVIYVKITQKGAVGLGLSDKSVPGPLFRVFPNPIWGDYLIIKREKTPHFPEITEGSIYRQDGILVNKFTITMFENEKYLFLPNLPKGPYSIVFRDKDNKFLQAVRIIK
jgi:photosystem II stability/assembly factor-like uncharacterized protein